MALKRLKTHDKCSLTVQASPGEVDAGTDLTLTVQMACPHGCDLSGVGLSIRTGDDAEVATAVLGKPEAGMPASGQVVMLAPPTVGGHGFRVAVLPVAKNGIVHEAPPAEASVTVRAHATRINVWNVPSAIVAGERFSFKVGVNCSAGCPMGGRPLRVVDANGKQMGTAMPGDDVWPGTSTLYVADVTAEAPAEPGGYEWELIAPEWNAGLPHMAGAGRLTLKVVSTPDYEVTIETVDREDQTPIRGAHIVMHPYRAVSDEAGVARLKVARGDYFVLISGSKHAAARRQVSVTQNIFTRAELEKEPPALNPDETY